MIEIKGKYNSAKVLVDDYSKLEEACYKQILNLLKKIIFLLKRSEK